MILIFSGTTEGRKLAETLTSQEISCTVCTATEYGGELMEQGAENERLTVHTGRMDQTEMTGLMHRGKFLCVVDATHPFAVEASSQIRAAAGRNGLPYLRLSRRTYAGTENVHIVNSMQEAAEFLRRETVGNILITTGSKELASFTRHFPNKDRLFARVLPLPESLEACKESGIRADRITAMQGPFSQEMNEVLMKQIRAEALLTKESGVEGGFREKLLAAKNCGVITVVLHNPENRQENAAAAGSAGKSNGKSAGHRELNGSDREAEERGYTAEEIIARISSLTGKKLTYRKVTLAGIGPGSAGEMTQDLRTAAVKADLIFGAESILKKTRDILKLPETRCIPEYEPEKILSVLKDRYEASNVLILLSGDPGFYSGAERLRKELGKKGDMQITSLPGISCLSYFAAKIGIAWQDIQIISAHGKPVDIVKELYRHDRIFLLTSGVEEVAAMGKKLLEGFSEEELSLVSIWYGFQLSGEDEEIAKISAKELSALSKKGLYVLYFDVTQTRTDPEVIETRQTLTLPRVMIAAPKSGSGKTMLTAGLLKIFSRQEKRIAACKCGPDYIDTMFHRYVLGIPSINLDTYFTGEDKTRNLFAVQAIGMDLTLIEGVMGFEDGLNDRSKTASSAHLASVLDLPVILCVDAKGISNSIVPLIRGFLDYGEGKRIRGVVLNRVSPQAYDRLKGHIEKELPIRVLGYLPDSQDFNLESRRLGLVQPFEIRNLGKKMEQAADLMEQTLDLEGILEIAGEAPGLPVHTEEELPQINVRIAVARDEAFSFTYEDNLRLLKRAGAEIIPFSPLYDQNFPNVDGLILPGGYPELYASALTSNEWMRKQIRQRAEEGMPILAECGGYLYLCEEFENDNGRIFPMVGLLSGTIYLTDHLSHFGYAQYSILPKKEKDSKEESGALSWLKEGEAIRGHEFHYYDASVNGGVWEAKQPGKPRSGSGTFPCMQAYKNVLAGFPHLYYESNPEFAVRFLQTCLAEKEKR